MHALLSSFLAMCSCLLMMTARATMWMTHCREHWVWTVWNLDPEIIRCLTNIRRQFTIHPHPCGTPRVRLVGQPRFACLSEQYVNGTAGAMPIMNCTESISTSCDAIAFPIALVSNANCNDPLLEQPSSCVHVLSQNPKWRVANWFPYISKHHNLFSYDQ